MDAKRHYEALFDAAAGVHAFAAQTHEELQDWQQRFRPELRRLLGLGQLERELAGYQPQAALISSTALDGYVREEWQLQIEPTLALPFYLLRPLPASRPAQRLALSPRNRFPTELIICFFNVRLGRA